jgi:hypothetical protein
MKTKIELEKEIPNPSLDQIETAYIGKPDTCMCGCAGDYFNPRDNPEKVKSILHVIESGISENIEDYIFTRAIGNKQYTIYLKK